MQDLVRRVFVPVMADKVCREMPHGNYDKITPRMFCAGYINGTKDSCQVQEQTTIGKFLELMSYSMDKNSFLKLIVIKFEIRLREGH